MTGNVLNGDCGAESLPTGNVLGNPCPPFSEVIGNRLDSCNCDEEEPEAPAEFIELFSELGLAYARAIPPQGAIRAQTNSDSSDYSPGDVLEYRVVPYIERAGTKYFSTTSQDASITLPGFNGVDLIWPAVNAVDGFRILRSLNGSGFVDYFDWTDGTALGFSDGGYSWTPGSTITPVASEQVPLWQDQTVSDNDESQATVAAQPLRVGSVLNGYPAVRFNGNDAFHSTETFAGQGTLTVVGVFKRTGVGAQELLDLNPVVRMESTASNQVRLISSVAGTLAGGPSLSLTPHYFVLMLTPSSQKFWLDGALLFNTTFGATGAEITKIILGKTSGGFGAVDWFALQGNLAWTEPQALAAAQTLRAKYALAAPSPWENKKIFSDSLEPWQWSDFEEIIWR